MFHPPTYLPRDRRCRPDDESLRQDLPETGGGIELDLALTALLGRVMEDALLYTYIVDTVDDDGGGYLQAGCSPNWQGGVITLCACKHKMRAGLPSVAAWQGVWVAGFTGINKFGRGNYLVYLMRVGTARSSQRQLWNHLPPLVRGAKSARYEIFGDLYQPRDPEDAAHAYDYTHYFAPVTGHVHEGVDDKGRILWHKDIDYPGAKHRPALLAGEGGRSFVWSRPVITSPEPMPRTKRHRSVGRFLRTLQTWA